MDGIAREQRRKLETIESELVDVKRRLERLYDLAETTDLDIEDFKPRIHDHRERQERLEASAAEARTILSPSAGTSLTTWKPSRPTPST